MILEHLFYSAAIAIVVGLVYSRFTKRDPSWIIILSAFAPDVDLIINPLLRAIGFTILYHGNPIVHGDLHNIAVLVVFAVIIAFLLNPLGISYFDSVLMGSIGFDTHLFEDALVYTTSYEFLWPISPVKVGFGVLPETHNFFHIANAETLFIGTLFVLLASTIRIAYEGFDWMKICYIWKIP